MSSRENRFSLSAHLGGIDIYLLDQLLRDRIQPEARLFEVGFGAGRNLVHFLRAGYDVSGVDRDPVAVEAVGELARQLAPQLPAANFRAEAIEDTTFEASSADFVISCAVLHFARNEDEFRSALEASWRILAPGGIFFCRLASTIGMEGRFRSLGSGPERRRFGLPDGSERYLVDARLLELLTEELGGRLLDPIKTTVVQDQRCMTTWVVLKFG